MKRIITALILIVLACLLAGAYGAVHNQISYTVGPDYFHALKFIQFRIPEEFHNRIGAAIVGWFASWWMGLLIGTPLAILALLLPSVAEMTRIFLRSAVLVVTVTLILGCLTLVVDWPAEAYALFLIPTGVVDETGFIRAAVMHEMSYGAGMVGLVLALIMMGFSIRKFRRGGGK